MNILTQFQQQRFQQWTGRTIEKVVFDINTIKEEWSHLADSQAITIRKKVQMDKLAKILKKETGLTMKFNTSASMPELLVFVDKNNDQVDLVDFLDKYEKYEELYELIVGKKKSVPKKPKPQKENRNDTFQINEKRNRSTKTKRISIIDENHESISFKETDDLPMSTNKSIQYIENQRMNNYASLPTIPIPNNNNNQNNTLNNNYNNQQDQYSFSKHYMRKRFDDE